MEILKMVWNMLKSAFVINFLLDIFLVILLLTLNLQMFQKQPSKDVLMKTCSDNVKQIYRGTTHAAVWFQ